MSDFAFETVVQVRYRDLDTLEHVNNAVYASYLELGRSEYFDEVVDVRIGDGEMVIARLELDYRAPILLEDGEATVTTSVVEMGRSSLTMDQRITVGDRIAAESACVIVAIDDDDAAQSIPDAWRESIESFEDGL